MKRWDTRLGERIAHGREKHGNAPLFWHPSRLLHEASLEAADVAGWTWVLLNRTADYPEDLQAAIRVTSESLTRTSLQLYRGLDLLGDHGFESRPLGDPNLAAAARQWLTLPVTDASPRLEVAGTGRNGLDKWRRAVRIRTEMGVLEHGDASFSRDPNDLVREIGDELCGLAGWVALARHRLADVGTMTDGHLRALVRTARETYQRLPALSLLVLQESTPSRTRSPARLDVMRWLDKAVPAGFRTRYDLGGEP